MTIPIVNQIITEGILRPMKKPIWCAVHALTGIRMQMSTHYLDASTFGASFRAPSDKVRKLLPSQLLPVEVSPGFAEVFISANEFRHIDILYPYNEVAIAIPVSYQMGGKTSNSFALWFLHLPVSTEDARWPGVENYGFPKFVAEIGFDYASDTPSCHLVHNQRKILTIQVKTMSTSFQKWEIENITLRSGRLVCSLFSAEGQRGIDETPGGGSISFGDHPIAEELQSLGMEISSFRHEYTPKAKAVLSVGREEKRS